MDDLTSEELMTLHQSNGTQPSTNSMTVITWLSRVGLFGCCPRTRLNSSTTSLSGPGGVHAAPCEQSSGSSRQLFHPWPSTVVEHIVLNHVRAERRECRDRRQTMPLSLNLKFALAIPDLLAKKRADDHDPRSCIQEGIEVLPAEHLSSSPRLL